MATGFWPDGTPLSDTCSLDVTIDGQACSIAGRKLNELPAVVGKVALRAERLEADLAVQGVQLHPAGGGVLFGGATDPAAGGPHSVGK